MASGQTSWQDAFLRECGIRRGIILHGNVVDVVADPSSLDRWQSVPDAVDTILKQRGYRHVIRWDRVAGVSGVDSRTWRELAASAVATAPPAAGEDYDMGEPLAPSRQVQDTGSLEVTPQDFLSVVSRLMKQPGPDRVAFVLDWSHLLFGQANALSEAERGWLLMMGKATRDAQITLSPADVDRPQTLMVFLCQGLSVLPPSLYLNNPLFKEINVPLPSRVVREAAVLQLSSVLSVEPPVLPKSRVLADIVDSL